MTGVRLYNILLKTYQAFPICTPILFYTDAPHGRFAPDLTGSTLWSKTLSVNAKFAWMAMEIPSPLILLYTYTKSPLATTPFYPLSNPTTSFLVLLWLIHYTNRAVIQPLRTPNRSRVHAIVPLAGVVFNTLNASLVGSWLSSGVVKPDFWKSSPAFWFGISVFLVGFVGNVWHDEVLLNIRREKINKEKQQGGKGDGKPYYAIPYGGLYRFISYPNYFCEWLEWSGFAFAASVASDWSTPFYSSPPWLFVINEIAEMLPRAGESLSS
ncbi:hypothetical protein FRB96_002651 [Tulasnella sp. 330]|nr:hypothetical protein FRB96_002651 [Tulasnella sp. 330]KAG8882690.1 hypothetical protein FRB98_003519 [Tulasnella sp. 332]